ncbi:MAG: DUF2975 domain-containing protein [Emticicia sp.]
MKTQTEKILNVLRVIAWIGYIGSIALTIIGGIATIYFISFPDADFTKNVTISDAKLSFRTLKNDYLGRLIFYYILFLIKIYFVIKIWKLAKDALTNININNPFTSNTSIMIEKIAHLTIIIGVINFIIGQYTIALEGLVTDYFRYNFSPDLTYIFGIGIIYLISQIFKRGVELQEENELTV